MAGYKVRLGDGSEIGPMDLEALKTWQLQGLVDGDSFARLFEPLANRCLDNGLSQGRHADLCRHVFVACPYAA